MQNFNYHSHTSRCGHAAGEDEAYVQYAIENGYQYMGFSDHAPYTGIHTPVERMDKADLPGYIESVKALQKKYADQIEIRIGLEFEYFEAQMDDLREYREQFDFLILGQHEPAVGAPSFYDAHTDADVLHYADLVCQACAQGLPDLIAHPDLFLFSKPEWTDACTEATHRICQSACEEDIPLEVNLSGLRYGKRQIGAEYRYPYPYRNFWEIAQQYPLKVVYGLDAHEPKKYADKECFRIVQNEILYDLHLNFLQKLQFPQKL